MSFVGWWVVIEGQDLGIGSGKSRAVIVLAAVSASAITATGAERRSATTSRSVTGKSQSEANAKEARESGVTESAANAIGSAVSAITGRAEIVGTEQRLICRTTDVHDM